MFKKKTFVTLSDFQVKSDWMNKWRVIKKNSNLPVVEKVFNIKASWLYNSSVSQNLSEQATACNASTDCLPNVQQACKKVFVNVENHRQFTWIAYSSVEACIHL